MGDGRHGQEAGKAADRAGNGHSAHIDAVYADACITGSVLRVADDGDLIALLGVAQIGPHGGAQNQNNENSPEVVAVVALAEQVADPAGLGVAVDNADGVGAEGVLPFRHAVGGEADGDIVHHQGEQGLVGIPLGLEEAGDQAPDTAQQEGGGNHADKEENVGHFSCEVAHEEHGTDGAHQHLAFRADVPEAHLEGRRQTDGDAGEDHHVAQEILEALAEQVERVAEGALRHGDIDVNGVQADDGENDDGGGDQGEEDRDTADQRRFAKADAVTFGNTDHCASSLLNCVIIRPISSLVVAEASTMPLT